MKSSRLTALFMFASLMAATALAQGLTFNSQFYGPGYYRVINAKDINGQLKHGRTLSVASDKVIKEDGTSDLTLSQIEMMSATSADELHNIHANAGSIIHVNFVGENQNELITSSPYGIFNFESQDAGTAVLTKALLEGFGGAMPGGVQMPLDYIPVNVAPARTRGEVSEFEDGAFGPVYQANFSLLGASAIFRDNNNGQTGVQFPIFEDMKNFGFTADGSFAVQQAKNIFTPERFPIDEYCNWYLAKADADENYYTPTYSGSLSSSYINGNGRNWATVYVDFPFILPNGAKAYKVKNDGTATEISTTFIPARTPVLLSWPASDSKTEVKLMPGLLTQAEINEAASTLRVGKR